jgi:ATP-binding cassette, subfamily C, bacterial CydC
MRDWRFLWRTVGPQQRWMALGTLAAFAAGIATVGLMTVGGGLLAFCTLSGLATAGAWNPAVGRLSAGIRFFAIARTLGRYGERMVTHDATLRILARLRARFFAQLAPLAPGGLGRLRSGDLLDRLVADVDALTGFYIRVAAPWTWSLALVAALGLFLAWVEPTLAAVSTGSLLVAVVALPWLGGRWGRDHGRAVAAGGRRLRVLLLEALQGRTELLIYGAAESRVAALRRVGHDWIQAQDRFSARTALLGSLSILVAGVGLALVLLAGTRAAQGGASHLTPTLLAAAVLAVITAFEVVAPLAIASPERERVRDATARLRSVLEAPPPTPAPAEPAPCPEDTTLELEQVEFGYPDSAPQPILDRLDLTIPAGQHLAILGPSGAGKSTLVQLLTRLRDPDRGQIRLGGTDLRRLDESDLRRQITAVEQRPHLFGGSLRENLRLGRPDADDKVLIDVLKRVGLPLDATTLPDGLDTWLSGTGDPAVQTTARRLSGGEARRVALARALLREPPVLILDEPSEDLDPATAQRVLTTLLDDWRGRTLLLVTHHRRLLEQVDRVLLLEAGKIVEDGDHASLLATGGRYADLWHRLG